MNVDESSYPYVYDITKNSVTIKFSNTIKKLCIDGNLQMEEILNGSNSYIGFDARLKNNWVGGSQYGTFKFGTGSEGFGKIGFESSRYERRINYRPVIVSGSYAENIHHNYLRWTNMNEPWVTEFIDGQQTLTINNTFTNDSAYIQYLNNNEVLRSYPIVDIDLDKIVLDPRFFISRVTLTKNSNGVYTGYSKTTTLMRYSQLKPQDKTAQGASYNSDLWEKGFKLVSSSSSQDVYDICIGCYVVAYIGNAGSRVSLNSISFSEWTTDAGKPAGTANFGVMQETLVDGSVTYSFIPGIFWTPADVQVSDPEIKTIYGILSNRYTTSLMSSTVGTAIGNNMDSGLSAYTNEDYSEIITDYNFFTEDLYDFLTYPTIQNTYHVLENGQIMRIFYYDGARYPSVMRPCYPIKDLVSTIASMGFFFVSDGSINANIETPGTNVYRGNYTSEGISDGTWKQGDDIDTDPLNDISYIPDIPDKPEPKDGDDNTESGDKVPNQFGRTVGVTSNFITNYLMTEGQISKLGEVLWTSWADDAVTMDMVDNFYGKFHDATGSWNVSDALQFIVSCRLFPCSLATLVNTTQVSSIPIGTGAFALQCGTQSEPNFFIANEATAILNCGEIEIRREYNDYRDFENTKITAYLPFCGSVELNPQDVVGKWLGCTYAIDLFDGSCKAFIYTLSGNDVGYEGAYYNVAIKQGQCGFLIPMSGTQAGQVASRQKVDGYTDGALLYQAAAGLMESAMALGGYSDANPVAGFNKMITAGTASSVLTAQRLGRAGISAPTTSGGSGFTDFHQPASAYVQIRRSYYQEPLQYEHSIGYPTNGAIYDNLSQFTGFIKCVNVDLSGFTCHEDERSEIKALLESGVYL